MSRDRTELLLRRGRLQERIASQRAAFAEASQPVQTLLYRVERGVDYAHAAVDYLERHPVAALVGGTVLFVANGRRLLRWTRNGFFAWRAWLTWRSRLLPLLALW